MFFKRKENYQYKVVDIETESLTPSTIWCCVTKDIDTDEIRRLVGHEEIKKYFLEQGNVIWIGHNSLAFDVPCLNRILDLNISLNDVIDTYTLSQLYNPALDNGHSLEAWGSRLNCPKGGHSDWSRFSQEMLDYCEQDVHVTHKLFSAITKRMIGLGYSEKSAWIEHQIKIIIEQQQRNGFWFDKEGAIRFLGELRSKQTELSDQIQLLFPKRRTEIARRPFRRTKDGSPHAQYGKDVSKYYDVVLNPEETEYVCYDLVPFNLGSPKQRVERLLELGWQPEKFTETGFPKVDEDALVLFAEKSGRKEVSALAEWLVLQGRSSMIETWLKNLGEDSRIHGRVNSCGASTRRMVHSKPNSANIPSGAKAKYGNEVRALWGVEPGKGLIEVGADASGLENVGLLHYLNNKKATEVLTQKKPNDVHTMNARAMTEALGFECDRDWAGKTCVPLDTTILTRRGWKRYNEVEIGEDVLGYNQETKKKEWTKLLGVHTGEDEVIQISNSYRTFRATKDHRWFVRQRGTGLRPFKLHYMEDQVRTTDELTSESSIIMNAPFNTDQDNNTSVKDIDGKYDVNWEQKVLDMSHAERVQWLQGFMLADGYISNTNPKTWRWSQNVGNIAEAALLCSYLVHDGQVNVSERQNEYHKIWTGHLNAKSHITGTRLTRSSLGVQPVWCPQTELGSWVMRQGNEITITGNCFFALVFGAGDEKLGSIVKRGKKEGKIIRECIIKNVPGFDKLLSRIEREFYDNHGRMETIDHGSVLCPSLNAALNYKVQSLGAVVMKLACIRLHEQAKEQDLPFKLIGTIHDEFQMECLEADGDRLGKLAVSCMTLASQELKMNIPLYGEYRLGKNWSECH